MKAKIKHIAYFLVFILTSSCADEEIPWEITPMPDKLVVEGSFTNEVKHHLIKLTSTSDYFSNKETPRVSNATVSITDLNSGEVIPFFEKPSGSGVYVTLEATSGIVNHRYRLNIILENPIDGENEYHAEGTMIEGLSIDSLSALTYENPVFTPGFGIDSLLLYVAVYGYEPQEIENYYQVNLYKNDQLLNDTIDEETIIWDEQEFDGEYVNTLIYFEQFEAFEKVTIEVLSVEKGYMDFVNGISNLANQSGDPFDISGPPANALGNMSNEAIGFFKVAYISRRSTLAIPAE